MRQIRLIFALALAVCLLAGGACLADTIGGLSAAQNSEGIVVTWNACAQNSECTLTVYRNGWPAHIACVDCAQGKYIVPNWACAKQGKYTVRLRCANACQIVDVIAQAAPGARPTVKPTTAPTAKPTIVPTVKPTPAPTVKPTPAPTVKPTPKPTPGGSTNASLAAQVIELVNAERAKYGLSALTESAELNRAACVRAAEIVSSFSHTRPDGSAWSSVSGAASGENIAKGYASAQAVVAAWMNSEGHRENILRENFRTMGVCAYVSGGVVYWAQLFGR